MKTIVNYEGQKNTIQGECKPREAMMILGLTPKDWKVSSKETTGKALVYNLERVRSLALVPVPSPVSAPSASPDVIDPPPEASAPVSELTMTDALTGTVVKGGSESEPTIPASEIKIDRAELIDIMQVVCDITAKKGLMPVLSMVSIVCVRNDLHGDRFVTISATDLELFYTVTLPAAFTNETAFLVDASILSKEVKALNKSVEDVVITVNASSIEINGRCTLSISTTDDFPEIARATGPEVKVSNLKAALSQVLPAVSVDETRYILTGVNFDLANGYLVGTDGFRLHRASVDKGVASFIVPRRAAVLMLKYGADTLRIGEKQVSATILDGMLTSRVMEGNFPDYRNVWPDDAGYNKVYFKAKEFLELIPGVLPVSEGARIDMTINGRIDIEAESANGSYKWHVPADSTLAGETRQFRLNCRFLVDAIRAYADLETIDISFPSEYGALVVNEQALIMPMKM